MNNLYFLFLSPLIIIYYSLIRSPDKLLAFDGHNAFILLFAKIFSPQTKLYLFVRSHPIYHGKLDNLPILWRFIIENLDKIGHHFSQVIVYNSKTTALSVEAIYNKKDANFNVVYNDIPKIKSEELKTSSEYKSEFGIPSDSFVIGFNGQFIKRKNIEYLLKAFSQIKSPKKVFLLIKGKGPLKKHLINQAKKYGIYERVRFLPWDNNMTSFYRAIEVFVLPSLFDDCSNSLLEALGHDTCVLASNKGGSSELLENKCNLLFDPLQSEVHLTDILQNIVNNDSLLKELKSACKQITRKARKKWEFEMEQVLF